MVEAALLRQENVPDPEQSETVTNFTVLQNVLPERNEDFQSPEQCETVTDFTVLQNVLSERNEDFQIPEQSETVTNFTVLQNVLPEQNHDFENPEQSETETNFPVLQNVLPERNEDFQSPEPCETTTDFIVLKIVLPERNRTFRTQNFTEGLKGADSDNSFVNQEPSVSHTIQETSQSSLSSCCVSNSDKDDEPYSPETRRMLSRTQTNENVAVTTEQSSIRKRKRNPNEPNT
ncbi:unnamed protein product [Diabrotica balteata]|uniref:Uncharacterized protein n=1 Tax=Diabrotica balteata TaxID=107213 RepID=A0A9N9T888_DIABA|nr:unnamed protein product [Diabrotica balteata]